MLHRQVLEKIHVRPSIETPLSRLESDSLGGEKVGDAKGIDKSTTRRAFADISNSASRNTSGKIPIKATVSKPSKLSQISVKPSLENNFHVFSDDIICEDSSEEEPIENVSRLKNKKERDLEWCAEFDPYYEALNDSDTEAEAEFFEKFKVRIEEKEKKINELADTSRDSLFFVKNMDDIFKFENVDDIDITVLTCEDIDLQLK